MHDSNDQYKRPQRPDKPIAVRPTIDRRRLLTGCALVMGMALLMVLSLIPQSAQAPGTEADDTQVALDAAQTLQADCILIQHLTYTPCGHSLTRRQALPGELAGKTRTELAAAYDAWQVTSFAPTEVRMEQSLAMYCPSHAVLLPDEGGMLCIWVNRYGDALALVKELGLAVSELPDSLQDEVRQGKGFDTQEALEKWLESVES